MKTNLTLAQVRAREKVYNAHKDGKEVHLNSEEVNDLWQSILSTSIELSNLRERVRLIKRVAEGES